MKNKTTEKKPLMTGNGTRTNGTPRILAMILITGMLFTSITGCKPGKTGESTISSEVTSSGIESGSTISTEVSSITESLAESDTQSSEALSAASGSKSQQSSNNSKIISQITKKAVSKLNYTTGIKPLPGTKSKELLKNPNRGFRLELTMNPSNGNALNSTVTAEASLVQQLDYYKEDSPQLAQNYIYLTDYSYKDLDQKALDNIQKYFDALKRNKIQSLLRFCYEYNETNNVVGPTTEQMLRHMKQLKPIVEKNKDLIHVIQAAFIGLWGEWHHPVYPHDEKTVLEAILDMAPESKFVQVRLVKYKNVLDANDPRRSRVSYHDDYLVGEDHGWSVANANITAEYKQLLSDAPNMLIDGEMPWGTDTYYNHGEIDGTLMAQRLQEQHFTSMSVVHNYKEGGQFATYNMVKWKSVSANESYLKENGLRYAPAWLKDSNGKETTRSVFAYIRDYLGYYIAADNLKATVNGKTVQVSLDLMNYGFSAPLGMKEISVVITDKNNQVIASRKACDLISLQPGKKITVSQSLSASELYAGYKIGIRFVNAVDTPAKLANDVEYANGVNTLLVLQ